jgi:hypothetical protein
MVHLLCNTDEDAAGEQAADAEVHHSLLLLATTAATIED